MKSIITSVGALPAQYDGTEGAEKYIGVIWFTYDVDVLYDAFVANGIDPQTVTIKNVVCTDGVLDVEELNLATAKEDGLKEGYALEALEFASAE